MFQLTTLKSLVVKSLNRVTTIWKNNTSEGASLYFLDPNGHKLEIHAATLETRLEATKEQPYEEMEFFYLDGERNVLLSGGSKPSLW